MALPDLTLVDDVLLDGRNNDNLSAEYRAATSALVDWGEVKDADHPNRRFDKLRFAPASYGALADAASGGSIHSPRPLSYLIHLRAAGEVLTARDQALLEVLLSASRDADSTFAAGSCSVSLKHLRAVFGPTVRRFEISASLLRLQTRYLQLPGIRAPQSRTVLSRPPEELREWERELYFTTFDGNISVDPLAKDNVQLRLLYIEQCHHGLDDRDGWDDFYAQVEDVYEVHGLDAVDDLLTSRETSLGLPLRAAYGRKVMRLPLPAPSVPVRTSVVPRLEAVPAAPAADPSAWWGSSNPVPFHPVLRHVIVGDDVHFEIDPFLAAYLDHRRFLPYAHLDVTRVAKFNGRYTAPIYRLLLAKSFCIARIVVKPKRRRLLPRLVNRSRQRLGHNSTELTLAEIVEVTGFKVLSGGLRGQVKNKILDWVAEDFRGTRVDILQVRRFQMNAGVGPSTSVSFDMLTLPSLDRMQTGKKVWNNDLVEPAKDRLRPLDEPRLSVDHFTLRRMKIRFGLDEVGHDRIVQAFQIALDEALNGPVHQRPLDPSHRLFRGQRLLSMIRVLGADLALMLFADAEARRPDLSEPDFVDAIIRDGTMALVTERRHARHRAAHGLPAPRNYVPTPWKVFDRLTAEAKASGS